MKTTKIFSVLSLALIFAVSTSFAKKNENPIAKSTQAASINYEVVIHTDVLAAPCNTYLIKVVDEFGRLVAPAQVFAPGINKYSFKEKVGAKTNKFSRRVAMLVPAKYPDHFVCAAALHATPDVKFGPFLAGQTYYFDLQPRIEGQGNDE
jgi:hypothetical protein